MLSTFVDMVNDSMKVFMDDFLVVSDTLEECLDKLSQALEICVEKNSILNWEKCNFMVKEGKYLGIKYCKRGWRLTRL